MQLNKGMLLAIALLVAPAHAFPDGPEPGYTGGPGQQDCSACHYAGADKTQQSGIKLNGLAQLMVPGDTYQIELVVLDPEQRVGGFQLAVRYRDGSEEGRSAGRLSPGEQQRTVTADGIEYLLHGVPQSAAPQNGLAQTRWNFEWTAPPSNSQVEIAVAAVAANHDDSSLGDNVYLLRQEIKVEQTR